MGMAIGAFEPHGHYCAADLGLPDQALHRRHACNLQQALAEIPRSCFVRSGDGFVPACLAGSGGFDGVALEPADHTS
jgi:hypothetical protein